MSEISIDVWDYFDNLKSERIAACKLCRQRVKNHRTAALNHHLRKYHSKKSEIWKYFVNIAGEGFAECLECKQRVRNNHSSNLIEHMQKSHNIEICDFTSAIKLKNTMSESITTTASAIDLTETEDNSRTNVSDEEMPVAFEEVDIVNLEKHVESISDENQDNILKKRSISRSPDLNRLQHKRAKTLIDINVEDKVIKAAVWGLMVDEGVEPSLFSSKNMQGLIQPICEAISKNKEKKFKIGEEESEKALCLAAEHLRKKFSKDLDWRLLSLKIDMDLNGPPKTFCVSACFMHEGKIQKRVLGVIDLHDDAQLTEDHVKNILHKFNIDIYQIIFACWDNTKPQYNKFVKNSEYLKEIVNLDENAEIHFGDIKFERYVGTIAHLCLLDIFKNNDIYQLFLECRNVVKYISNESNGFYEIFQKSNLTMPQLDSPWKWGSTYKMLQNLQEARSVLENENYPILELTEDQFTINNNFWLLVDAFCESLKFLHKSITKYYTEELHFGDCYAQWLKCKLLTGQLVTKDNSQNEYVKMFSSELQKCIEIRTKDILSKDAFLACLYLDPRFQHTLSLPEKSKAVECLNKLWSRSKFYSPDVPSAGSLKNSVKPEDLCNDEDKFLNEFLCQDAQKTSSTTDDFHTKIERLKLPFKPVDTNISLFWDSQKSIDPEMFFISNICLAIPTTQNYNQNLYAHLYKKKKNSKITTVTRDNLVLVRLNSHVFEDNLEQFGIFREEDEALQEIKKTYADETAIIL